jgi:hypothetical protein
MLCIHLWRLVRGRKQEHQEESAHPELNSFPHVGHKASSQGDKNPAGLMQLLMR